MYYVNFNFICCNSIRNIRDYLNILITFFFCFMRRNIVNWTNIRWFIKLFTKWKLLMELYPFKDSQSESILFFSLTCCCVLYFTVTVKDMASGKIFKENICLHLMISMPNLMVNSFLFVHFYLLEKFLFIFFQHHLDHKNTII